MTARVSAGVAVLLFLTTCFMFAAPAAAQQAAAPDTFGIEITGDYGPTLPPNIAKQGYAQQGDMLINLLHVFMAILFVGWGVFMAYCLVRFRQRPGCSADSRPIKAKPSKYSEVVVVVVEAVLLIGVSIPAWASMKNDLPTEADNPVHVRVIAEQFAWNFHYPGKDGVFGRTSPKLIDVATNPMGLDEEDPNAEDDFVASQLHIPVDRPVIAQILSKDVIHSFSVPVLRVKQDAIPGMRIPVWFEATQTGNYEIACAQLCGNNHYSMRAIMVVESAMDFEAWMVEQSKPAEEFDEDL